MEGGENFFSNVRKRFAMFTFYTSHTHRNGEHKQCNGCRIPIYSGRDHVARNSRNALTSVVPLVLGEQTSAGIIIH